MSGNLYAILTRAALHRRLSLTARALLAAGAAFPVLVALAFAADNLFNFAPATRTAIGLLLLGGLLAGAARLYLTLWRAPADPARTAVYLEQRCGISDNRLINAVHFDRDPAMPAALRQLFTGAAESACAGFRLRRVWQHAHLAPAAKAFAAGLLLLLAYLIPFGQHARNALYRYLHPSTSVMPLNFTQFTVAPGDAALTEGESCRIRASAAKFDRAVGGLDLLLEEGGAPLLYPMRAEKGAFVFDLKELSKTTRYAVKSGNDRSRWYTLAVVQRPRLDGLTVTVTPPAYTGEQPRRLPPGARETAVLRGSRVTVDSGADTRWAVTFYRDGKPAEAPRSQLAFTMEADTEAAADVKDGRGLSHASVWRCRFKLVADAPPELRLLNRELNVQAAFGQSVPLSIEAGDDYGLTGLEIYTVRDQTEQVLKRFSYRELRKERHEYCALPVTESLFARNASYPLWVRASDNHAPPQNGRAPAPLTLHIADPTQTGLQGEQGDPYVRLFGLLTQSLELQKELRDWTAARVESDRKERIGHVLRNRQEGVHERVSHAAELAADLSRTGAVKRALAEGVAEVQRSRSAPLLGQIRAVAELPDERRPEGLNAVVLKQTELAAALQRLLGLVSNAQALDAERERRLSEETQDQKLREKLQALKEDLAKLKDEQKRVLRDTEAIDKKPPEDWTEAEEKLLGDLAAKEQEFAKLFRSAFNDLSKVANQDFSNSTMADELVEMIEELQKAGAALEKKHIEIATVAEELVGEQAESIETNLERWLSDSKDFIKWNGEDGETTPDVPLQDLPEEMTDIIGELIDDVSEMEDVEDSTNNSLNSMDKGIGWGVSDGNMNDMSAKGITGNVMPNNNEVGGRSGEGRSGKSSGQFVEQEATGKGGRDTPTRLVQTPFEKGTVKDTSKDPQGGATGGGKQSGLGGEGLRGITPDQKPDVAQRLPGKQAELKQKAEALVRELNVRNLPTGDLEDAVSKMEQIQKYQSSGQGLQARQVRSDLLASLKEARAAMAANVTGGAEKGSALAKRIATVRHPDNEATPDGYEESVDAYFRALADPQADE